MDPTQRRDVELTTFKPIEETQADLSTDSGSTKSSSPEAILRSTTPDIQATHESGRKSPANTEKFEAVKGRISPTLDPMIQNVSNRTQRVSFPILRAVYAWAFPEKLDYSYSKIKELPPEVLSNTTLAELDLTGSDIFAFPDLSKCVSLSKLNLTNTNLRNGNTIIAENLPKDRPIVIKGSLSNKWPEGVTVRRLGRDKVEVTVHSKGMKVAPPAPLKSAAPSPSITAKPRQDAFKLIQKPSSVGEEIRSWSLEDQRTCLQNDGFTMGIGRIAQSNAEFAVPEIVSFITGKSSRLDLNNSLVASLPGSIFEVGRLKELDCGNNPDLSFLPPEISTCTTLEKLDLSNSGIRNLPDLSGCTRLREINLSMTTVRHQAIDDILKQLPKGVPVTIKGIGEVPPSDSYDVLVTRKGKDKIEITVTAK